jgi:plasmid maintenance system antidote protein VapI
MRKEIFEQAHAGFIILEDILTALGMSVNQFAKAIGVTPSRLNDIVLLRRGDGRRIALGALFGHDSGVVDDLPIECDLLTAREEDGRKIERAVKPREAAQREERPATAAISGLTMPSDSETLPIEQAFEPSRLVEKAEILLPASFAST